MTYPYNKKRPRLSNHKRESVSAQQVADMVRGSLSFLDNVSSSVRSAEAAPLDPVLLDTLGVREAPQELALSSFDPDDFRRAISQTLGRPLMATSSDPYVRKFIGVSKQPTVPSVLAENVIVRSWGSSLPWSFATNLTPEYYYGIMRSVPDAMTFTGPMEAYPNSADLLSYLKVITAIRSGTYSQSARMDSQVGPNLPLLPVSGSLASVNYNNGILPLADSLTFDPMNLTLLAPRLATRLSSSDFETRFAWNGQLDPKNENDPNVVGYLPYGSAYGFDMNGFEDDVPGSSSYNAILEFFRQLVCSPLLKLSAIPRSGAFTQLGLAVKHPSFNWATLTAEEARAFTPPQSVGTTGNGGISVKLTFALRNDTTGEEQDYPTIDFSVNLNFMDGVNPPSLLIPRGASISNVFHPGFKLPDGATSPIEFNESSFYSYSLAARILTWGSANNYTWALAMSNPSASHLSILNS